MPETLKPATPPDQHRFHFLDALRGIAALLVVPRHAPKNFHAALFFFPSFLAVDFFFCLSGFVVAFSYEQRLRADFRFPAFALTRALRLYPLAILGTLVGIAVALARPASSNLVGNSPRSVALAVVFGLFVLPLPGGLLFPLNTPMWTLALELLANFAYGLLMRLRLAHTAVLAVFAAAGLFSLALARRRYGVLDLGYSASTVLVGLSRVTWSFTAGILLCRLYRARTPSRRHGARSLLAALGLTGLLVFLLANPFAFTRTTAAQVLTVGLFFPAIVYLGTGLVMPGRWATACAFLGTISYPIYVLHQPLLASGGGLHLAPGAASNLAMLISLAVLTLLAWVAAEFYDIPVRRTLTRHLRKTPLLSTAKP